MIGQTLAHYRIAAALGAGGMGEVYRATDTRLDREVAIKILPAEVAKDPERLARFEREAHLLASLNHPNIAAIYGLEEAEGQPFLALELVEGEDLKERLGRGAIPVDEALEIAKQIAEALEEAHDKGIVHRDLKPANVKLTPEGKVKVLDFGLAKAWAGDTHEGSSPSGGLSQSPTLAHTGTVAGVILGTAAYMSPEQARGKPVDKRADVWAFGVLLWEMLTGRSLFAGDTVTDVIAAVVTREPDLDALPKATPRAVRRLVARCLRKDPRTRLPDVGAARLDLEEALSGTAGETEADETGRDASAATEVRRLGRQRWAWAAAFLLAAGLAGALAVVQLTQVHEPQPAGHFLLDLPENLSVDSWGAPAVSPDGRQIAFAATPTDGPSRLWVRALESLAIRSLDGTEHASLPFWSPDGGSVGFFAQGELRRISLANGTVQRICTLPREGFTAAGDWAADGTVLFSAGGMTARLYTVLATGGEAKPLTTHDEARGEIGHWWPQFLPDGRHFVFEVFGAQAETVGLHVASLDEPAERVRLLPAPVRARYGSGHILFVRDGTLLTQPLQTGRRELTGEPVAVATSVASWLQVPDWGWFSTSSNGLLAYVEGDGGGAELAWFDRSGKRLGSVGEPGVYGQIALSPDERRVAVEHTTPDAGASDIWTIDLARGVATRVTFDPAIDIDPTWSPDGRELVFSSNRGGAFHLYRKALQGNEPPRKFGTSMDQVFPESWSADGKALIYGRLLQDGQAFGTLPLDGDAEGETILEKSGQLDEPQVSPDGGWLAYVSDESGRWEVYIEPFQRPGERVRVSPEGGGQPKWRGDGKELFYVDGGGQLMAVDVDVAGDRLEVGLPTALFTGVNPDPIRDYYAVTADGQRFLVPVPAESDSGRRIHVVTNWTSLLK